MNRSLLLSLLLAVGPACSHRRGLETPAVATNPIEVVTTSAEVVELRFGWPVGLQGQVQSSRERTRSGQPKGIPVDLRVDFVVAPHDAGVLISVTNARYEGLPETAADPQAQLMLKLQKAGTMIPDLVIGSDGQFVDLGDTTAMVAEIEKVVSVILEPLPEDDPARQAIEPMIRQMTAPEMLRAVADGDWNAVVGAWAGSDLELGAAYIVESEKAIPMLGGVPLKMRTTLGVASWVSCHEGDEQPRCVRIESETIPDEEALRQMMEQFVQQMTAQMQQFGQPQLSGMNMKTSVVLIAEPGTLIPHRLETIRSTEISVRMPDGTEQTQLGRDASLHVYTYKDR